MQEPVRFILMYLAFPLWVAAGFADWACHRHTRIEQNSGLKENLLHVLMSIEMGLALAAVAFLEISAAVLLLVLVLFAMHELTVYWDLRYSTPRRHVGPFEQMVHSFLEILPLLALALLAALAWPQAQALAGLGTEAADWSLRAKQQPLPLPYVAGALLLMLAFNTAPLFQETWACWRARREARARTPRRPGPR
jgi:hypothetical protein